MGVMGDLHHLLIPLYHLEKQGMQLPILLLFQQGQNLWFHANHFDNFESK